MSEKGEGMEETRRPKRLPRSDDYRRGGEDTADVVTRGDCQVCLYANRDQGGLEVLQSSRRVVRILSQSCQVCLD